MNHGNSGFFLPFFEQNEILSYCGFVFAKTENKKNVAIKMEIMIKQIMTKF